MTSTEYRREEFTTGKVVTWIFFVALALAVAMVSAWYGRERFQGPSNNSVNSSDTRKPTIAVVKLRFNLRGSPSMAGYEITKLEMGETLTLVNPDPDGPWYYVRRSDGTEGWVHGNGIDLK